MLKSVKGCIKAVMDEVNANPQDYPPVTVSRQKFRNQLKKMLEELREHHSEIAKDINSGKGLRAQYIDSEIAYKVITKMTDKDIPILCIHDSFICRDIDTFEVKKAMLEAYVDVITRETSRRRNRTTITEQEVKSKKESIIDSLEEYKHVYKDEVLHALNPVFRRSSSYYERYIMYLASKRSKATFNYTINVKDELSKYNSLNKRLASRKTIQEYCHVTILQEVLLYREVIQDARVKGGDDLVYRVLTAYPGGFCLPGLYLSGFTKLQKSSGKSPWLSAVGTQKQNPNLTARKWLTLDRRSWKRSR